MIFSARMYAFSPAWEHGFLDVAQENITPVSTHKWKDLFKCHPLFSRYFVDLEQNETSCLSRLLVSKELQSAYPEDEAYGHDWIRSET